ncbi:MAG: 3-oxoadipate enol-lactonase [Alphaproteobacteria bacterium]|nr:MAG: 3-oxoadipate enol-lactonase [Alphaproteobacteria bacterium]
MQMAKVNGIRVHYADSGPRDGVPLVFSNSLGTDFRVWDRLLPHLPEGLRIIRYDKRGHGLTECPAAPYAMETLVEDAAALIAHLELPPCVFVGLSIGGLIGQGLAAARPELLRAMVLCDTAARIGSADLWDNRIEAINRGGIAAIEEQILSRWFTESFRTTRQDELAGWRHMLCRTPEDGYLGCCYAIRDADFRASDPKLSLPVLVVAGEEDGSTPPALVEETAALIPGARFHVIKGAGHLPCVEQPEALGALIGDFLRENGIV